MIWLGIVIGFVVTTLAAYYVLIAIICSYDGKGPAWDWMWYRGKP